MTGERWSGPEETCMTPIVDAHHHFWNPENGDPPWVSGPFETIRRTFEPKDLRPALVGDNVSGTVLVQTWNELGEARDFPKIAGETDFVAGDFCLRLCH